MPICRRRSRPADGMYLFVRTMKLRPGPPAPPPAISDTTYGWLGNSALDHRAKAGTPHDRRPRDAGVVAQRGRQGPAPRPGGPGDATDRRTA